MDVVRILTFACVVAVHTISHTSASDDLGLIGVLMLVHFTRNVFFALSGFVLVYSYLNKPVPMRSFWPRRFLLVGVPYLVWSALYVLLPWLHAPTGSPWSLVPDYLHAILTGTAYYHLYFVLVTMQIYLLFPLLMLLVRKTRGHHGILLAVSGALQVVLSGFNIYKPGSLHYLHIVSNVSTYQGFIVLGAVAADHAPTLLAWVRSHRRPIALIVAGVGVATLVVYLVQFELGFSPFAAANPIQPVIMIWSVAIGLAFLAFGTWWADRRRPGSGSARFVAFASDRSFAIFLAHPLVLWFLLWIGDGLFPRVIARPWLTLVMYLLVVGGSVLIADVFRRTPVSLAFTGRPYRPRLRGTV
jgi:peptidoglycan/LPS O-acetylase OafA/YrhL